MVDRRPPFSKEFEKAFLAGLLGDPSSIPRFTGMLDEDDFFSPSHKEIFRTIFSFDHEKVDSLTVQDKLSHQTREVFQELLNEDVTPSLTNMVVYADTIKEKSKLRDGYFLGMRVSEICSEDNINAEEALHKMESMFAAFLQDRAIEDKSVSTPEAFQEFLDNLGTNKGDLGIRTGFNAIDGLLHRLEGLIILAGRPSTGKTALAINIARNVAETKPVVFFSLEQTRESIFERILAAEAEVNSEEIRNGTYKSDKVITDRIHEASDRLFPVLKRIHVDDRAAIATPYIASVSRQKQFEWGEIGLIIVDYLHIMRLNDRLNKVDSLGDAVKELRALGKELGCPVLLLSQLNRQPDQQFADGGHKKHRRPELTDLRASGEIEQSADVVMFLYRESYYDSLIQVPTEDVVEILVRKNRNGKIGISTLGWIPRFVKFKDLE